MATHYYYCDDDGSPSRPTHQKRYSNRDYLLVVGHYSKYPEYCKLPKGDSSSEITNAELTIAELTIAELKTIFGRFGIPVEVGIRILVRSLLKLSEHQECFLRDIAILDASEGKKTTATAAKNCEQLITSINSLAVTLRAQGKERKAKRKLELNY
ncbi:hypothetical protein CAPTEDRAFT_210562 [Capitella teleta]|uniref:Uncharacterized protein n=1 Tax=Capitella teleta TaxID=283909 RepID=R7TN92_CAPTE|nr:hypothetical protein CAPTEDRAFT_210562 [Capitella teleta]|eukprot:ELT93026.1 hypothetical protein CAPTEDRAFT_210562 [Capitella teleta]